MNSLFSVLTSTSNSENTSEASGSERLSQALKVLISNPIFYVIIVAIVLLIILVYLFKRIVKAKPNSKIIIVRKGQIFRIVDDANPRYFLAPFVDSVGAIVSLGERTMTSDRLFINNGPDFLYQINFTLVYEVVNAEEYYKEYNNVGGNFEQKMIICINDHFREYADKGNALVLVKDYHNHIDEILDLFNEAISPLSVRALSFKINFIQPIGK